MDIDIGGISDDFGDALARLRSGDFAIEEFDIDTALDTYSPVQDEQPINNGYENLTEAELIAAAEAAVLMVSQTNAETENASPSYINMNNHRTQPQNKTDTMQRIQEDYEKLTTSTSTAIWNEDVTMFNTHSNDHKHIYMAKHTMKMLKMFSLTYGIPLGDLYKNFGDMRMYTCCHGNCKKIIYGEFYCEKHRGNFTTYENAVAAHFEKPVRFS